MNVLDKIKNADDKVRVSFLSPDRAAEDICDIGELRQAIRVFVTTSDAQFEAYEKKELDK